MAVATFSWRWCHKTGNSGEERQLSGHLQSPTVIDDGRLVSSDRTMHYSAKCGLVIACRLFICLSVTLVDCDHRLKLVHACIRSSCFPESAFHCHHHLPSPSRVSHIFVLHQLHASSLHVSTEYSHHARWHCVTLFASGAQWDLLIVLYKYRYLLNYLLTVKVLTHLNVSENMSLAFIVIKVLSWFHWKLKTFLFIRSFLSIWL